MHVKTYCTHLLFFWVGFGCNLGVTKKTVLKTVINSIINKTLIVFLLLMILFIWGYSYHRLNEKPGTNIDKKDEGKQEHIPDTTDPVLLNRF